MCLFKLQMYIVKRRGGEKRLGPENRKYDFYFLTKCSHCSLIPHQWRFVKMKHGYMGNLTIDFRSISSLNYRNAKMPRINMRKEQETKTFEENWKTQTLGLKSDLSGMPRIDGTTKRKRLENPGRPHSLPGATKKFPPLLLLSSTHSDHPYRNTEVRRWEIHSVVWDWKI